ncbi:uncharacterized protein DFL_003023 [Arthrobotrys flagrans]|uniref:Uncharacterized protein n=1 Tax=Arthrobotrys flagrans TaxID=97331 RepID=A0A437ACC2_ARTFL|nr:hypothetical protein DFL_003023 [Arthrobotrys flagrans]
MDQIQDLKTPSSLHSFISQTRTSPTSPIALLQFYNSPFSIQWAASTLSQISQLVSHFSQELNEGSLIFGRIDGSILPRGSGAKNQFRLDTNYEVSYGIWWQGMQQVYEVNALEEGAEGVVEREVEELLKMRGEMMDVERTRAGGSKRGVVGGDNKRRWPIARPGTRPGPSLLRRGLRVRGQNSDTL